jgi:hypothetical protein
MFDVILSGIPHDSSSEQGGALVIDTSLLRKVVLNKKGGLDLEYAIDVYDAERQETMTTKFALDSPIPVHEDLTKVFVLLGAHLAYVTDQVTDKTKGLSNRIVKQECMESDDEIFGAIYCKQVVLKGKPDEDAAVMLFGGRRLKNKQHLALNGSLVKLNEEDSTYSEVGQLENLIEDLRYEISLYLGGKRKPFTQMEIGFTSADQGKRLKRLM